MDIAYPPPTDRVCVYIFHLNFKLTSIRSHIRREKRQEMFWAEGCLEMRRNTGPGRSGKGQWRWAQDRHPGQFSRWYHLLDISGERRTSSLHVGSKGYALISYTYSQGCSRRAEISASRCFCLLWPMSLLARAKSGVVMRWGCARVGTGITIWKNFSAIMSLFSWDSSTLVSNIRRHKGSHSKNIAIEL